MSVQIAGNYLSQMVEHLAPALGREDAVKRVARTSGLTYWAVYKLIRGSVKSITTDHFFKIRAAYLDWCLREIRQMQSGMEAARDADLLENLEAEVLALREKLRQAKTRTV